MPTQVDQAVVALSGTAHKGWRGAPQPPAQGWVGRADGEGRAGGAG